MRKLVSWDKGSLRGKAKPFTQTKQNHFMASSHQQAGVQPLPGRQSLSWLRGKSDTITLTIPYAFLFFPKVLLLSTASCGVGYPFGPLGTDVPGLPLLSLLCTLPYSERRLKVCLSTAQQQPKWTGCDLIYLTLLLSPNHCSNLTYFTVHMMSYDILEHFSPIKFDYKTW